jgi:hypothetical protein
LHWSSPHLWVAKNNDCPGLHVEADGLGSSRVINFRENNPAFGFVINPVPAERALPKAQTTEA